jgi:MFS family permease
MSLSNAQPLHIGRRGFWAILLTLFMVAYNVGVMPASMASIVIELDSSVGSIQSILVVFSLITAAFAPTTENLCRFYGRTRIFGFGLGLYGIGIGLTALSSTIEMLAFSFALLMGLGATPLISTPWAMADLAYDGRAEEQAKVALILTSSLGALSGALLGGYLAFHFSWRWAFLPSLLLVVGVVALGRSLPNLIVQSARAIDWVGGLLSLFGLGSIFVGIGLAAEFGWWLPKREFTVAGVVIPPFSLSIVPTLLAVGVICLGFFGFWQRRQTRRCETSLVGAGVLRKREFVLGLLTAMVHTLIATGLQFNLYQFVPIVLGLNPFRTALAIIPYNITLILVLIGVVKYSILGDRWTPKQIVCSGIWLLAAGIGLLYASLQVDMTAAVLLPSLLVMGLGSGLFLSYISMLTYSAVSAEDKPQCPSIYNPVQNLGSSLGRSILGTALVFFTAEGIVDGVVQELGKTLTLSQRSSLIAQLQEMIQTLSRVELRAFFSSTVPPALLPTVRAISLESATAGLKVSLTLALMFTGLCLLLATTLPKYPANFRARQPQ